MSKEADNIVKGCRHWENITMNNEAEIEDTDKATRNAKKIGKMRIFLVQMMHDFSLWQELKEYLCPSRITSVNHFGDS